MNEKQVKTIAILTEDFDICLKDICEKAGITRKTILKWFGNDKFLKALELNLDHYSSGKLNLVWKALVEECTKGNIQAIKLYFDLKGKKKDDMKRSVSIVDDIGKGEISD